MAVFGAGEILGGLMHGLIIDRIGSKKTVLINIVILILMAIITIISIHSMKYNYLTIIMCLMWGYQDSTVNVFLNQVLGYEFENNTDPYAVFQMWQGFTVFAF